MGLFIEGGSLADDPQNYLGNLDVIPWTSGTWQVAAKGASRSCAAAAVCWIWSAVQDDTDVLLGPPLSCSAVTPLPILSKEQRPFLECRLCAESGGQPGTLFLGALGSKFTWQRLKTYDKTQHHLPVTKQVLLEYCSTA